jgi:hypothetical protein
MSSHSEDNKENSHKSLAYALQFLNPFDSQNKGAMGADMVIKDARASFFKIYKTTDGNPQKQIIPILAEKSLPWMADDLSEEKKAEKIKKGEFVVAVMSSVLFTLKHELGLNCSLIQSRDKDEIFCQIFVDDEWMVRNAKANEYEIQFKRKDTHVLRFMEVSPYCSAHVMESKDKNGEYTYKNLFKIYDAEGQEIDYSSQHPTHSMFTSTDRRRLVMKVLMQRIDLHQLKGSGVMIEDFCVHEETQLNYLKENWASMKNLLKPQPLDRIRGYFAEKIAMYFAWINVYWKFMMTAGSVGLITFIGLEIAKRVGDEGRASLDSPIIVSFQIFYAVFLAFWASSFEQLWIREENRLSWKWGTTNLDQKEDQRPEFKGKYGKDEVSGTFKVLPDPAENKCMKKFVSYIVIFFFMCLVIVAVGFIFYIRWWFVASGRSTLAKTIPAFLNALQIRILNMIYSKVVGPLNDWENHETENQQYDNLALKNFAFKFVNSYTALFYMAFLKVHFEASEKCLLPDTALDVCPAESIEYKPGCKNCMYDLGFQLSIIFITNMCMNVMEIGLPWLKWKVRMAKENSKIDEIREKDQSLRTNLYQVEKDSKLEAYETPADDYMEMIIQFGYVALFGVTSPIIAFLALLEITLEIRVDAWKICNLTKRPDPHRANSLGVWKEIIVTVAYVGAVTNSALIVFTSKLFDHSDVGKLIFYFIVIEHALFGIMYVVSLYVDDVSTTVIHGINWGKRKVQNKFLSWNDDNDEVTAEFNSSKGGEEFFVKGQDFKYQES